MNISANRRRLSGQEFKDELFAGSDLRGAKAYSSVWRNCTFDSCKMGQADFRDSIFNNCFFVNSDLRQAILVGRIHQSSFVGCDLDQATLVGSVIDLSKFEACRMQYALLSLATVTETNITDCDMHGAILDFAYSKGVDFSGSNLWGVVVPLSCAFLSGNKFDSKQANFFLALTLHAKIPEKDFKKIEAITDPWSRKVVDRIVRGQEEAGQGGEEGMDSGRGKSPEMVT